MTSVGAFGTGFFIQAFENNGLTAEEGSRLRNFSEQDWIQNNPGYNWGVFSGKLSGILQAGGEYFASAAIFTGGNGLSIVASPVTGGASLTASPAATAGAAAVAAHGTLVWQSTIQSFANNSNYGSGGSSSTPESLGYKKTNERSHGQAVYKNSKGKPKYITKDVDSHNGGAWKGADSVKDLGSKKTRTGTYDSKLNRIGD